MSYSLVKPRNLLQSFILFKARIWSVNQVVYCLSDVRNMYCKCDCYLDAVLFN